MAEVSKVLDFSGLMCPMPVVKTAKALKEMAVGDVFEMISTDPGSMPDMQAWANQTKHDLIESREEAGKFHFIIKKTH